jgi:DNA-binding transcriptional LysR family regulator
MDFLDISYFLRMPIRTRQLLLLLAINEHRNIHKAAAALHMTQPGASKQLKELEDLLKVTLFERLPRGLEPTAYGKIMVSYAQMALSNLSAAHSDIQTLQSGLIGTVKVGALQTPAMSIIPVVIAKLSEIAPRLHITVEVEYSLNLIQKLLNGSLDLIMAHVPDLGEDVQLESILLKNERPSVVVVGPQHPLSLQTGLALKDAINYPWIMPEEGTLYRGLIDSLFVRDCNHIPERRVEAADVLLMQVLLNQAPYLGFMPLAVAQHLASLGMVKILDMKLDWSPALNPFGIFRRADRFLSPGAELFMKTLREEAKKIDYLLDASDLGQASAIGKINFE